MFASVKAFHFVQTFLQIFHILIRKCLIGKCYLEPCMIHCNIYQRDISQLYHSSISLILTLILGFASDSCNNLLVIGYNYNLIQSNLPLKLAGKYGFNKSLANVVSHPLCLTATILLCLIYRCLRICSLIGSKLLKYIYKKLSSCNTTW